MAAVIEEGFHAIDAYASIPIAFRAETRLELEVVEEGFGGFLLKERAVSPFLKDYDAIEGPASWATSFDVSRWGVLAAYLDGERVGGVRVPIVLARVAHLDGRVLVVCFLRG
jgi:hypothetical protein